MSFSDYANKSVNNLRTLVQLDISKINLQWVNAGAGIWYVNFDGLYPEVGPPGDDLLQGFTSQSFGDIGSVLVDTISYTKVDSLLSVTSNNISFYYDDTNKEVYVHFINNDEPFIHDVWLSIIYGFSYNDFIPIGSNTFYDGRITDDISFSESRDPLFFGKMQYNIGSVTLNNSDGYFDTFQNNLFYGNPIRFLLGFSELDIDDYITVASGIIEKINISEDKATISLSDKRKTLSKNITYSCTNKNALEVIRELLLTHYNAYYDSSYYDMTAWGIAEAVAPNITIDIAPGKGMEDSDVIDIIEMICTSIFGLFKITPENKYSFKIVDTTASSLSTIINNDIIGNNSVDYDPYEVISSAKIGYNKNWNEGYTSPYTFYYDTSYENSVFLLYKVYNQKQFNTVLIDTSALTVIKAFSNTILNYSKDVHGIGSIKIPIKYYEIEVGDIYDIEINRETTTMLGTKKCEILSKSTSIYDGFITCGYRII
jgi:hypothetical protein